MNWEEVKAWIEANKGTDEGLKAYLQGLNPLTVESVQNFVNASNDAKKWFDSEKDKHHNKAFETWKTNNYQKELEAEIKKRYPEADPKDLKMKELELKLEQMQKDTMKKELTNNVYKIAQEKEIPVQLVDFLLGDDLETTNKNIETFQAIFLEAVQKGVEVRMGDNGYVPPKGGKGDFKGKNPWSKDSINLTEQAKILKENPELAKTLKATAVK